MAKDLVAFFEAQFVLEYHMLNRMREMWTEGSRVIAQGS